MAGFRVDGRRSEVGDFRLLEPRWAEECTSDELQFIKGALKSERRLRTAWGFVHGTGRISDEAISLVAIRGLPDDRGHNAALVVSIKAGLAAPRVGAAAGATPSQLRFDSIAVNGAQASGRG